VLGGVVLLWAPSPRLLSLLRNPRFVLYISSPSLAASESDLFSNLNLSLSQSVGLFERKSSLPLSFSADPGYGNPNRGLFLQFNSSIYCK
jgi:hypothetical protein